MAKHPMQPIVRDEGGIDRFKENRIVRFLLAAGPLDLNMIGEMGFSDEDRRQFAQLRGCSVTAYGELPYVRSADWDDAVRAHNDFVEKKSEKIKKSENKKTEAKKCRCQECAADPPTK